MGESLEVANELYKAGKLDGAAELYVKILLEEPANAAALHSLGMIHSQWDEHARATELIALAIAERPNAPFFHVNLGEVYRNLGDYRRAIGSCRIALKLNPDFPEGLNTLGLSLQGAGRLEEAIEQFRRALALRPGMAPAHNNLGLALQEAGRPEEAIEHFRRAVELGPELVRPRSNLGAALLDRGRAEEALVHFREAARLQPDQAPRYQNIGNALRILGRHVEARAAYFEALRLNSDLPLPHLHVGMTLRADGQFENALPWHRAAVELAPDNASFWAELAELHGEREAHDEAIPCWERALALAPGDRASSHIGLGSALQEEGRLDEARAQYRAAAVLKPDLANAHLSLGSIHEELGEMAEAEAAFREARRLQPGFAIPHARLGTLLRGKLPDADLEALESRLADPGLAEAPRARLLFSLAHVLDARGDYGRAAECLRRANALNLATETGSRTYVPADHDRFIEGLIGSFGGEFFDRAAGGGLQTTRPIFIVGLPRSGTTLIEQVLASHPRIYGAGELRLARRTFEAIPPALGRPGPPIECIADLGPEATRRLAEQHLGWLEGYDGGRCDRIVDKMPDNYLHLGLLASLFPDAVFIHARRDLRDVAVSCWMTDFRSIRWANDPAHIASRFRAYRRLWDHWRDALPVPVHAVDYEESVDDLEGMARRLLDACGLEWDPACLEFHRTRRSVRTASVTQVRQPIYKRSVARWRNYEESLGDLFAALPIEDAMPV